MSGIVPIHWRRFEKVLFLEGCVFKREKGDHRIYWKNGLARPIVLPQDTQVPVFVIRNNMRLLGLTVERYLEMLEEV